MAAFDPKTGKKTSLTRILFNKYDTDGSGSLDSSEFKSLCYDKGYYLSDDELEAALARLDPEAQGTISFESFQSFWRSDGRFAALQLNEEQEHFVAEVTAVFRGADTDVSGVIDTQEEWEALFGQLCSGGYVNPNTISGEQVWNALDKDQEGTVCFSEYLAWMLKTNGHPFPADNEQGFSILGKRQSLAAVVFSKYDKDGNASISADEFKSLAYDKGHYLSDEEVAAAISSLASDGGDGALTMQDFQRWWEGGGDRWGHLSLSAEQQGTVAALVQCFKWFDANGDGTLSAEEWPDCYAQLLEYEYVLPEEQGGPTQDELFDAVDTDSSGSVACNEFLAYCIAQGALGAGVGGAA